MAQIAPSVSIWPGNVPYGPMERQRVITELYAIWRHSRVPPLFLDARSPTVLRVATSRLESNVE